MEEVVVVDWIRRTVNSKHCSGVLSEEVRELEGGGVRVINKMAVGERAKATSCPGSA